MQRRVGLCLPELAFAAESYSGPGTSRSLPVWKRRHVGQAAAPAAGRERPPRGRGRGRVPRSGGGSFTPLPPPPGRGAVLAVGRHTAPPPERDRCSNPLRSGGLLRGSASTASGGCTLYTPRLPLAQGAKSLPRRWPPRWPPWWAPSCRADQGGERVPSSSPSARGRRQAPRPPSCPSSVHHRVVTPSNRLDWSSQVAAKGERRGTDIPLGTSG